MMICLFNRIISFCFVLSLTACTTVQEAASIYKLGVNAFELSDQELREIEQRPLPNDSGVGLDLALSRRALAAMLLADVQSIQATKKTAIQRASQEDYIISIMGMVAFTEKITGNTQQARREYEEIEKRLLRSGSTPSSIYRNSANRGFLTSYLSFAAGIMDWKLGDRLVATYFDPASRDQALDFGERFILQVAADDYRFVFHSSMGDPNRAYIARVAALEEYEAGPLQQLGKFSSARMQWKNRLSSFRHQIGVDAVNAGQPMKAVEQLNLIEASWDGKDAATAMVILELQQILYWHQQDYEAALTNMEAFIKKYPTMVNRIPAVRDIFLLGKTQYLTGLGLWQEAFEALSNVQNESASRLTEEYKIGYKTLIEANLKRTPSTLREFTAAEPSFKDGKRGIQAGIGYYGISTTVFWKLASRNGNSKDLERAISSGRYLGEALRKNKYHTKSPTSPLPAPTLDEAKEAYALASTRGIAQRLANYDDLLNAIQLLQMSETDRDIAAMALRLSNIPGVKPEKLRALQDLQRRAWASQNKVVTLKMAGGTSNIDIQTAWHKAQKDDASFNALLSEITQVYPRLSLLLSSPNQVRLSDIQHRLHVGEALLAVAPLKDSTLILLIEKNRAKYHVAKVDSDQIGKLVNRVRTTTSFEHNPLLDFDTGAANELYNILLGWSNASLDHISNLHVTTTGPLASLPFSLLLKKPVKAEAATYDQAEWLIKDMATTHMLTISAWYSLDRSKASRGGNSFIAWASPFFGNELPPVDNGEREAKNIASALEVSMSMQTDVISGSSATRSDVLRRSESGELARKNIVLFATHGVAPGGYDGLPQPALAMTVENNEVQFLTLEDILDLRLSADWVILSACDTDAADKVGGDPLSGLARGFFFAGAKGLLLTHWKVNSLAAADITTLTMKEYAQHPERGQGEALRKAVLQNMDEWQHPAYWAPFSAVGGQ